MTGRRLLVGLAMTAIVAVVAPTMPAVAATSGSAAGRVVALKRVGDQVQVVFQADGLPAGTTVDPTSVKVSLNGRELAVVGANQVATGDVTRVAMLAIDNSKSMRGEKFAAAKLAASTFLDNLPPDVKVGLVVFGKKAVVKVPPTSDPNQVRTAVAALGIDPITGTALYDAAAVAADAAGSAGARNVLLLTDGGEDGSSGVTLDAAVAKSTSDDVALDAVYIGPADQEPTQLQKLVTDAGGQVVAGTAADIGGIFERAALAISSQLIINAQLPASGVTSGSLLVTATAGTSALRDDAFLPAAGAKPAIQVDHGPKPITTGSTLITRSELPVVLGALFLGLLLLLVVAFSAVRRDEKQGRVRRRLSVYTLTGRSPVKQEEITTALGSSQVARSAVELAGKVVQRRDFEDALALRLEAAAVPLRAAEWMLIHIGVAIGCSILLLLISGGAIFPTVLGLVVGLALPWAYLIVKESRRTSAFLAQLPDTLQLVAGSLSAGYSMPQAMDTVVREGQQPITAEFNRALVEARLGVPIEDAMESIADRMKSKDFAWVVMAIRIQREVGGNLAELLTTVSATLRERERLRRQVKVLSAEGRLSAWILGLLPVVFALYLALVRPAYLKPLVSETLGWLLVGLGVTLLTVGALWMRKAVKVEV